MNDNFGTGLKAMYISTFKLKMAFRMIQKHRSSYHER